MAYTKDKTQSTEEQILLAMEYQIAALPATKSRQDDIVDAMSILGGYIRDLLAPNLDIDGKSFTRAHVAKGAAGNAIAGATAFDAGALIEIVGLDTAVWVGADGAQAILNTVGVPAGVPFRFTLGAAATTFYIDAATDGVVIGHQVNQVAP